MQITLGLCFLTLRAEKSPAGQGMLGTAGQFPSQNPDNAPDNAPDKSFAHFHCQKQVFVLLLMAKLSPFLTHLLQGSCPSVPLRICFLNPPGRGAHAQGNGPGSRFLLIVNTQRCNANIPGRQRSLALPGALLGLLEFVTFFP